jgi:RNA polymerase sigma factor (TIGR02999 family)
MSTSDITTLLQRWRQGDAEAPEALFPLVYEEMRKLAKSQMRSEASHHTLQPTELVGEVYLKLIKQKRLPDWRDRNHFMAIAALAMRQFRVDYAKARLAAKRNAGLKPLPLDKAHEKMADLPVQEDEEDERLLALDNALFKLEALEPLQSKIVTMRCFGEMQVKDVALALNISEATVKRHWSVAKAWLARELQRGL